MSIGDLTVLQAGDETAKAIKLNVGHDASTINPGEPVSPLTAGLAGLNSTSVIAAVTSSPIVGTTSGAIFYYGIAATTSTQTTTADGSVDVIPLDTKTIYLISPKTAATWNTQAKYDDLVGSRVTIDLTAGAYTLNATDSYLNGCVVQPLDIAKYPGKVAIKFRAGANVLNAQ